MTDVQLIIIKELRDLDERIALYNCMDKNPNADLKEYFIQEHEYTTSHKVIQERIKEIENGV